MRKMWARRALHINDIHAVHVGKEAVVGMIDSLIGDHLEVSPGLGDQHLFHRCFSLDVI